MTVDGCLILLPLLVILGSMVEQPRVFPSLLVKSSLVDKDKTTDTIIVMRRLPYGGSQDKVQDLLGAQGRKIQANGEDNCQQVWSGPLSGDRMVAALWNRCSKPATITASWDMIGLQSTVSVSVRDFWQHKDVTDNASVSFEAHKLRQTTVTCTFSLLTPHSSGGNTFRCIVPCCEALPVFVYNNIL